jgi:uncharacterized membrane protein YhaH (DUF805 family)
MTTGAEHRVVSFGEAPQLFLKNYAKFTGRSSRGAFWWWILINLIVVVVLNFVDGALGTQPGQVGLLGGLWALATLVPGIALGMRRMHDIDKSGWWLLLGIVPLVGLVLIWFAAQPGVRATNKFGDADVEAGREAAPAGLVQ